jgi:hypothetical protein
VNIYSAIKLLKDKRFVARREWPNLTYLYLRGEDIMYSSLGIDTLWVPSHRDLLRNDYKEIIPER